MLDLMAVGQDNETLFRYKCTLFSGFFGNASRTTKRGTGFDYAKFKSKILNYGLTIGLLEPLKQHLDSLEGSMPPQQIFHKAAEKMRAKRWGSN